MKTKRCPKCRKTKIKNKFSRNKSQKDGLDCYCKMCTTIRRQLYRRSSEGKIAHAKAKKKYHQTFPGQISGRFNKMIQRCNNPKNKQYKNYAKRGIECLFTGVNDLMQHMVVDLGINSIKLLGDLIIHRINNDGHYCRGNIILITRAEHTRIHAELRRQEKQK